MSQTLSAQEPGGQATSVVRRVTAHMRATAAVHNAGYGQVKSPSDELRAGLDVPLLDAVKAPEGASTHRLMVSRVLDPAPDFYGYGP